MLMQILFACALKTNIKDLLTSHICKVCNSTAVDATAVNITFNTVIFSLLQVRVVGYSFAV